MTTKYTFQAVFDSDLDKQWVTTTKEFYADSLDDILAEFREFLLGVGFDPKTLEKYEIDETLRK